MSNSVHVKSLQAIVEFRNTLGQFCNEVQQSLEFVAREIRRCQEWLSQRQDYWQRQVEYCQEEIYQARRSLESCQQEEDSDCSEYEYALSEAYHSLREAEEELSNVQHWRHVIEEAIIDYQRQVYHLSNQIQSDVPKAGAFLGRKVTTLEAYQAEQPASGISTSSSDMSLSVGISPSQFASSRIDSVLDTIKTASLLDSLTHIASYGIDWIARHTPTKVIGDTGEEIATYLLSEKCGFQEVPFDQPHQGFDRVFSAPGLPIIIVESKVSQQGKFRLGDTQEGQQGSPEWITAQVADMTNPDSKKWSPLNEQIAQHIQKLGTENIPVVTVVTQTETGTIDIHYRAVGSKEWQRWDRSIPLIDALHSSSPESKTGWKDTGICVTPIEQLIGAINFDNSHVKSSKDFSKVSYDEMVKGFQKLQQVVLPSVKSGASGDKFSQMDTEQGLDYEHGYRRIYDAFYGEDCIRVNKTGEQYDVINGVHRLFVAKELGIQTVPVRIIEQTS